MNDAYKEAVTNATMHAIAVGDTTIGEIAVRLGDVDPTYILKVLQDLDLREFIQRSRWISRDGKSVPGENPLPIPHPLDYDWRLTTDSIQLISAKLSICCGDGPVLLLGVPTVFRALLMQDGISYGADLHDRNHEAIRALGQIIAGNPKYHAFVSDARYDLPEVARWHGAFLDPPWYPEHTLAFLRFASIGCHIGSSIYLSVPGLLTRPSVEAERKILIASLGQLGLVVRDTTERALSYVSPPFEQRAFHQSNLDVPRFWRRGTLMLLEKVADISMDLSTEVAHDPWDEETVAGVRFKVRLGEHSENDNPMLRPALPGAVLPSVSRRDPLRETVDVWTSGNGVYLTSSPTKLLCILRALANGRSARTEVEDLVGRRLNAKEQEQIDATMAQIANIVASERHLYT